MGGRFRSSIWARYCLLLWSLLPAFFLDGSGAPSTAVEASDRVDGRYSFSLTTFDPSGKLGQVQRALEAASKGTPLVALIKNDRILMAAPQVLPSPLMLDDGTARFTRITGNIVIAHSGLSADGRQLVAAAQRISIEHEYTFDEDIPIGLLLEQLALILQEYTMKPATRPFGATLLIGYLPSLECRSITRHSPILFRIDPSGNVDRLGNVAVVNGRLEGTSLLERLTVLTGSVDNVTSAAPSLKDDVEPIVQELKSALQQQATLSGRSAALETSIQTILSCTFTLDQGFAVCRHDAALESKVGHVTGD